MPSGYLKHKEGIGRRQRYGSNSPNSSAGGGSKRSWYWYWSDAKHDESSKWWRFGNRNFTRHSDVLDRDDPLVEPKPKVKVEPGMCTVCLTDTEVVRMEQCGHTACLECCREFYSTCDLTFHPLRCFMCSQRVSVKELKRVGVIQTKEEEQRAYKLHQLAIKVKNVTSVEKQQCPYCDSPHDPVVPARSRARRLVCRGCNRSFQIPPKPRPTRTHFPREITDAVDIDVCPKCGNGIEKNGGCYDMTCLCGHRFQWLGVEEREKRQDSERQRLTAELQKAAYQL